jgi:hypothetical protein
MQTMADEEAASSKYHTNPLRCTQISIHNILVEAGEF